jgi:hypothetical protein
MATDTAAGIQRQIATADAEMRAHLGQIRAGMGAAASALVHAKIAAARKRRTDLYSKLPTVDVEPRYADAFRRDQLERLL